MEKGEQMSEYEAVPLEATLPSQRALGRMAEAKLFLSGLLFTAAVVIVGAALCTAALVLCVVGAPLIAAVAAYLVIRSRRAARAHDWTAFKPAAG